MPAADRPRRASGKPPRKPAGGGKGSAPKRGGGAAAGRNAKRAAPGGSGRGRKPAAGSDRRGTSGRGGGEARPAPPARAGWGGVARRGAASVARPDDGRGRPTGRLQRGATGASEAFRAAAHERAEPDVWIDEGVVGESVRAEAGAAVARGRRRRAEPVDDVGPDASLRHAVAPQRLERYEERLREAARAFRRGRYDDARRMLRALAEQAPAAESVRELLGLTYYRLGRWRDAKRELEAFHDLSGSVEQHPVLADVHRALGRHARVDELWAELRAASPSSELVAEGRIVVAGSLADRGRLADAIALLERAKLPSKRPREHHLRTAYALADLYERAGDVPRARDLFGIVARHDAELGDVAQRLRNLR